MLLIQISAENYKSFLEEQAITVAQGFNIFLGGNNAGKTTMLEVLDTSRSTNNPHRSYKNLRHFGSQPTGRTTLSITLATDIYELRDPVSRSLRLPLADNWRDSFTRASNPSEAAIAKLVLDPKVQLRYEFGAGRAALTTQTALGTNQMSLTDNNSVTTLSATVGDDRILDKTVIQNVYGSVSNEISDMVARLTSSFYRFSASRRPSGQCGESEHPVVLAPDASNLPYCLNVLQSADAHGHQLLCEWTNRVFPAVQWIQASPRPGNLFEIECLPLPPRERRPDLAVPLSQMGSGIGNVIAMLYVVLTARFPRVIAIDEPNSFLHPKALRELLQIFLIEGKSHQYLLTAHSADVLTAIPPNLVTMFEVRAGATVTQQVEGHELMLIREGLSSLGIRMTDLHGRDKVLWVEGQTEELVMPRLMQHFCSEIAAGTAVLRVEHTGTFEKKGVDPTEVANLYARLTGSTALVPPMVGILLDREKRSKAECIRLVKNSNGVLHFLDRPMLESYVLHPIAIAHVLGLHGESVLPAQVEAHITEMIAQSPNGHVDAAKILTSIFDAFTETRTVFKKTRDVPEIVAWLLVEEDEFLRPLGNFLRTLFGLAPVHGPSAETQQAAAV